MNPEQIRKNLLKFRDEAGYSRAELADMSGYGEKAIQRYESGENEIPALAVYAFAEALGRDPGDFFRADPPPPPNPEDLPALIVRVRPGATVSDEVIAEVREMIREVNERIRPRKRK